jgi:diguanylate cyclase (GGDEF)-like protein
MTMPVAAVQTREKIPTGASTMSLVGAASGSGPVLSCRTEDALATARQLFESWLRTCLRPSFLPTSSASERALPRTSIMRIVEKSQMPGSSNAESRRLVRQLAERLKGLEGLFDHSFVSSGAAPEFSALVLEVGLAVLAVFAKLEAERAAQRAAADPLTGLDGRRAMEERLRQERARTGREGRRCAVALLDVDHFKRVNDTHGHAIGDRVLVGIAAVLQRSLRSYDGVYRYGGEEFVLCLPGVDATVAHRMVERIRKTMTTTPFETAAGQPFFVSFSAGIAEISPSLAPARSLDLADGALYRAKSAGRNRVLLAEAVPAD